MSTWWPLLLSMSKQKPGVLTPVLALALSGTPEFSLCPVLVFFQLWIQCPLHRTDWLLRRALEGPGHSLSVL